MAVEWSKIKAEYIADETTSYRKLAAKYGVSMKTLSARGKEEEWPELRRQSLDKRCAKTIAAAEDNHAKRMKRIQSITDRLLDKIEQAVDELDIQLCKNVEKVREIEYNNDERPDKPTKEIIHEEEKWTEIRMVIDRKGAQELSSALKNLKEVQMLKSDLDKREQEARIRNLEKQAEADSETNEVRITIEGDADGYSV